MALALEMYIGLRGGIPSTPCRAEILTQSIKLRQLY